MINSLRRSELCHLATLRQMLIECCCGWTCSLSLSVTVTSCLRSRIRVSVRVPRPCVGVGANVCVPLVACRRRFHVNEDCAKGKRQTVATTVNDKQKRNN